MTTINDIEFIIACAGLSTRNYPHSKGLAHKVLLPFGSYRIIDFVLKDIISIGGKNITIIVSNEECVHAFQNAFCDDTAIQEKLMTRGAEGKKMANILKEITIPDDVEIKYVIQEKPLGTAHCMALANEVSEGRHGLLIFPDDTYLSKNPENPHILKAINKFLQNDKAIVISGLEHEEVSRFAVLKDGRLVEKPANPDTNIALFSPMIFPRDVMQHTQETMSTFLTEEKEWGYYESVNHFLDNNPDKPEYHIDLILKDSEDLFLDLGTRPMYEKALLSSLLLLSQNKDEHIKQIKELLSTHGL